MKYLVLNSIPENLEAEGERLIAVYNYFKDNNIDVKILTALHQTSLHQFIDRWEFDSDDVLNLYDVFQDAVEHKGKQRWYNELPVPQDMELFGSYTTGTVQDGNRQRAHIVFQPMPTLIDRYVGDVTYFDVNNKPTVIERWDWRGFKSSEIILTSDGENYSETFFSPSGEEKMLVTYTKEKDGFYIGSLRTQNGKDLRILPGLITIHEQFIKELTTNDKEAEFFLFNTNNRSHDYLDFTDGFKKNLVLIHDFPSGDGIPFQLSDISDFDINKIDSIIVDDITTKNVLSESMPQIKEKFDVLHGHAEITSDKHNKTTPIDFENDDPIVTMMVHGAVEDDINFGKVLDVFTEARKKGKKFNIFVIRKWAEGDILKTALQDHKDWIKFKHNDLIHESEARMLVRQTPNPEFVISFSNDQGTTHTASATINKEIPLLFLGENGMVNDLVGKFDAGIITKNIDDIIQKTNDYLNKKDALKSDIENSKKAKKHFKEERISN